MSSSRCVAICRGAAAAAAAAVILLLVLSPVAAALRSDGETRRLYEDWKAKYGRAYNALYGEDQRRYEVFKDNLRYIDAHNADADAGRSSFRLGLGPFADLTNDEYRRQFLGFRSRKNATSTSSGDGHSNGLGSPPDALDWRDFGAVSDVLYQGNCESDWAFSAISAVESANMIATGQLIPLSVQELIDCDRCVNRGCLGGSMTEAFKFIIRNGGINSQRNWPYGWVDFVCNYDKMDKKVVSIDDYAEVTPNSETALKAAVARQPVSSAIEAGGQAFQHYQSGIFSGFCTSYVDHGVLIVGYGSENNQDYWIVKNSAGDWWGEHGYIRMARNVRVPTGLCGIATEASYPIKKKLPSICVDPRYWCLQTDYCCCTSSAQSVCSSWGCCSQKSSVCCAGSSSCCGKDNPVYNRNRNTCHKDESNAMGVPAVAATPAMFAGAQGKSSE